MLTKSESVVVETVQRLLEELTPERFGCRERKGSGTSVISKPVDLEIYFTETSQRIALVIEVASVNATQLVGEVCRLYYDTCPLKLLVLNNEGYVPTDGKKQCESLAVRLYGQDDIQNTPVRVV